jgi:hypothetical protein
MNCPKCGSEKLENEFQQALSSALVRTWKDKSYHVAEEKEVMRLASFLTTNNIQNVFKSISDTEKKGFSDEEIELKRIDVEGNEIEFSFMLPNGAYIHKRVEVLEQEEMVKDVYNKYTSILSELKERQKELEEKAKEEYEAEKKRKEIERIVEEYPKLEDQNRVLKAELKKLENEIELLKAIVRKKVQESEIELAETDELTEEEKEYLREKVFSDDC